jgi:hypothetical protein
MSITIELNSLEVYSQCVYPALKLKINFEFQEDTIPVVLECQAFTDDMKFISSLIEIPEARFFGTEDSYSAPPPPTLVMKEIQ